MQELENVIIILVRPKYAENIGSAARAVLNMGLGGLCVVSGYDFDLESAKKTATHNASQLLEQMWFVEEFPDILPEFTFLVSTTARVGKGRVPTIGPGQIYYSINPYLNSGKVGIVFGPESTGLTNEELKHCGAIVNIPTAEFSSLNLAQSVAIVCYEIRKARISEKGAQSDTVCCHSANEQELASMYEAAETLLESLDSFDKQGKAAIRLKHLHQILGRAVVSSKEAKFLKDTCNQVISRLK